MGKRGPKSKFTELLGTEFVRLAQEGKTLEQISDILGVSKGTLRNWTAGNPQLMIAVREARQIADEMVEAALFARATGYSHPETKVFIHEGCPVTEDVVKHYPPDTQAAMFWLRNRQPENWREKNESDVTVSVNSLTDEQLSDKIAALLNKEPPK